MRLIHCQMFLMRMYPVIAFTVLVAIMLLAYLFLRKKLYRSRKIQIAAVVLLVIGLFCISVGQHRNIAYGKAVQKEFADLTSSEDNFYKVTAGNETFYFMNPKLKSNGELDLKIISNEFNIVQPSSVIHYSSLMARDNFPISALNDFIYQAKTEKLVRKIIAKTKQH